MSKFRDLAEILPRTLVLSLHQYVVILPVFFSNTFWALAVALALALAVAGLKNRFWVAHI